LSLCLNLNAHCNMENRSWDKSVLGCTR
jgi:hypothetical protein